MLYVSSYMCFGRVFLHDMFCSKYLTLLSNVVILSVNLLNCLKKLETGKLSKAVNSPVPRLPLSVLSRKIGGPESDESSGFKGGFESLAYSLGGSKNITVEVNNVLVNRKIPNVFGVIKGFIDPGRTKLPPSTV